MTANQNDCRPCGGWGCTTCRPRIGEQGDVELRERDAAVAAAVDPLKERVADLERVVLLANDAMNEMGDHLNALDVCEREDIEKVTPAFEAVAAVVEEIRARSRP